MHSREGRRMGCLGFFLAVASLVCQTATASSLKRELAGVQRTSLSSRELQTCDPVNFPSLAPTVTRAPVTDLQWLDKNDQIVLATTQKSSIDAGGLWYSSDGGKHWTEKTQLLNNSLPINEPVNVLMMLSQKSNPLNLVLFGTGSYLWTSSDAGISYISMQTPTKWRGSGIKSYKQHPRQENWLLVMVKRPDCKTIDHAQTECPYDLMLTQDLFSGAPTWKNLTADAKTQIAGFVDFDWGASLCPEGRCGPEVDMKDEVIMATMYQRPGDYDQPWDPDVHFVTSHDWFLTFNTHVRCGNMFEVVGRTIYLAMANSCPTDIEGETKREGSVYPQGITLYTSEDGGCSFVQACLPVAIKQEGYELLETHDGSGAIVVVDFVINNGIFDIPASSVYTAGPHHALFSLSLTDVYHADYGRSTDFAKVEGLPGVYISNQMVPRPDSSSGGGGARGGDEYTDYYDISDTTGEPMVESRITFNGGGRWQRIPAPSSFSNIQCNRCEDRPDCYLHLHGMSSWDNRGIALPAVYTNPSAPGFIMASGNTGVTGVGLDDNDGMCTWLSTDGGVSWRDVGVGAYIYEYADWGGVIVMAKHPGAMDKPAVEVLFSYDFGRCWQPVPLMEALLVDNIRIEPDGQRPRVVVHGRRCRQSQHQMCGYTDSAKRVGGAEGLMYLVDVQELLGTRLGMCGAPDREQWGIPADGRGSTTRCVLGHQTQLERRRPTSGCFNGPDYKRPAPTQTTCPCSAELDTECDFGYLKSGSTCYKIPQDQLPFCPVIQESHYHVSTTGKRLAHADTCSNIQAVIPDIDTSWKGPPESRACAGSGGWHRDGGDRRGGHWSWFFSFFIFLLVTCLMGGAFVGWWIYLATENQRDLVRDLVAGVVAAIRSGVMWVREKISAGRSGASREADLGYFQPLGDLDQPDEGSGGAGGNRLFTLK